jgi:hypothetical protein
MSMKLEDQMRLLLAEKVRTRAMLTVYDNISEFALSNGADDKLTEKFKVEHIALLLLHSKKRVLPELQTGRYPFNACLEECTKQKHQMAIAYLKDRLGHTEEALMIYKKRLEKHIVYLTSKKGKEMKPSFREKVIRRTQQEMQLAFSLCKNFDSSEGKANNLLVEWIDSVVDLVDKRHFSARTQPVKQMLVDHCQELLDAILDRTSFENFLQLLKDGHLITNKFLMERTVYHFRELRGMSMNGTDAHSDDWLITNSHILRDKRGATKTRFGPSTPSSQLLCMYQFCKHVDPVDKSLKEGKLIHCKACSEMDENSKVFNFLDSHKLRDMPIPTSDQFAQGAVNYYLT